MIISSEHEVVCMCWWSVESLLNKTRPGFPTEANFQVYRNAHVQLEVHSIVMIIWLDNVLSLVVTKGLVKVYSSNKSLRM